MTKWIDARTARKMSEANIISIMTSIMKKIEEAAAESKFSIVLSGNDIPEDFILKKVIEKLKELNYSTKICPPLSPIYERTLIISW